MKYYPSMISGLCYFSHMEFMVRRIKEGMDLKGWGQEKLAEKADVSQSTINRVLNNATNARIGTLNKIADALGYPVQYLVIQDETRALLCLELSRMDKDFVKKTLFDIEKEKLYRQSKQAS